MKILIVGGGIAGLTLGAFLENSDIEFDIIEKCTDWNQQGFLISMWDSGRDILKKIGLDDRVDTTGSPAHVYSIRDGVGRIVRNIDFTSFYAKYGSAITILSRSDLHAWLREKISQNRIRMGTTVAAIQQKNGKVLVTFTNGKEDAYDIVVGADGVHSAIRRLIFPNDVESYENWRVWYAWIDHAFAVPAAVAEYVAPSEFIIVCSAGNKTTAWFFAPSDHTHIDKPTGRIDRLKKLIKDETALVPQAIDLLRDEDLVPSDIAYVKMKYWVHDRVVLIGDAAHCMGPHAGIGSTMAMEDGYVLAGELMKVSASYPIAMALENYEKKRRVRITLAQNLSNTLKWGTFIRSTYVRRVANHVIPLIPQRFLTRDLEKLLQHEI